MNPNVFRRAHHTFRSWSFLLSLALLPALVVAAQPDAEPAPGNEAITGYLKHGERLVQPAPDRRRGVGPFKRLVIRGAIVIVDENPIRNLNVRYGAGVIRFNDEKGEMERVGGVRDTIKDGVVYDARQLLADVRALVTNEKKGELNDSGDEAEVDNSTE